MNLYLISQEENGGIDTYDSCVVCAISRKEAQKMKPDGDADRGAWATKKTNVKVEYLGKARKTLKGRFILKSFIGY